MKHRFVAEWIDDMDDVESDRSATSIHSTLEEARLAAVKASKASGAIQWIRIREQILITGHDPCGPFSRWETVARWSGDYDGIEQSL